MSPTPFGDTSSDYLIGVVEDIGTGVKKDGMLAPGHIVLFDHTKRISFQLKEDGGCYIVPADTVIASIHEMEYTAWKSRLTVPT